MSTTRRTVRKPPTGADHHGLALLHLIEGLEQPYNAERFLPYLEAARNILASIHAFDGCNDTLSVENYVMRAERATSDDAADDIKAQRRTFALLFDDKDADERDDVTV